MKPSEKMQSLAREQLAALTRQLAEIQRQMDEYKTILATLERLDDVPPPMVDNRVRNQADQDRSFASRIALILRSSPHPMSAADVARALEGSGFQYSGKVALKIVVASELARQARREASGIRKVAVGAYTAAA